MLIISGIGHLMSSSNKLNTINSNPIFAYQCQINESGSEIAISFFTLDHDLGNFVRISRAENYSGDIWKRLLPLFQNLANIQQNRMLNSQHFGNRQLVKRNNFSNCFSVNAQMLEYS